MTATKTTPHNNGMAASSSRTVLITGVSRGLGKALALELSKRGHTIIGCSRSQENLTSIRSQISPPQSDSNSDRHLFFTVDVRSNSSVEELAKAVVEKKAIPDIIVNNAGTINKNNKIWDVSEEEFSAVIDTNVKGTANVLRNFIPLMIPSKRGIIVNFSSGWGRSGAALVAPYCASKWAIEGLTRSVAKELPEGMAIVALNPGVINTEMLASCFGNSASLYEAPESWGVVSSQKNVGIYAFKSCGSGTIIAIRDGTNVFSSHRALKAATMILNLTGADNGASLTI